MTLCLSCLLQLQPHSHAKLHAPDTAPLVTFTLSHSHVPCILMFEKMGGACKNCHDPCRLSSDHVRQPRLALEPCIYRACHHPAKSGSHCGSPAACHLQPQPSWELTRYGFGHATSEYRYGRLGGTQGALTCPTGWSQDLQDLSKALTRGGAVHSQASPANRRVRRRQVRSLGTGTPTPRCGVEGPARCCGDQPAQEQVRRAR